MSPLEHPALDPSALGLSIGTTNVVAARGGRAPVSRRSVLTLWDNRGPEVGVPSQNPELTSPNLAQAGLVLRGFVERVGDPVPLVAADGSTHRGEALVTAALEALARATDPGTDGGRPLGGVVVATPAHWSPAAVGALRGALRTSPILSPGGIPPMIVSDATAALAALHTSPGLPAGGVVALCDFGGSGSSITLADAAAGLTPIGETVRVPDFSGDHIDQALLHHVLNGIRSAGHDDTTGTAAVGPLTRLREQCRLAKERLSAETATAVPVDLPGYRSEVRLTRGELDAVIAEPFTGFLDALGDALERNRIPAASLAAVATVGGGAAIPGISQRLSEALRVPVVTTPDPGAAAATGAAILAARGSVADAPTGLAAVAADAPTNLAPTAWASGGAGRPDGASETFRALAWSQGEDGVDEPVPYTGADYYSAGDYAAETGARPVVQFEPEDQETTAVVAPLPWYRRPPLLFGIAAILATAAVGGLAVTLNGSDSTPTTTTTRVTKPGEDPNTSAAPPPVPVTTTVTGSNGQPTVTTVTQSPVAPPTSSAEPSTTTPTTTTTTTTTPTTTTTTTTTTTPTTTTTTPTTTRTTTTTTPPPTTTTAPPPTTTAPPPPTTTAEPVVTTTVAPPPVTTTVAPITTQAVPAEPVVTTTLAPLG